MRFHVLDAFPGHCVKGDTLERAVTLKYVRLGEYDLTNETDCIQELNGQLDCMDPPVDYAVEKVTPHPLYNPNNPSKHHDLAILKLNTTVKYSDFVQPICLPTKEFKKGLSPGSPQTVTGWGKTDLCKSFDDPQLTRVNQPKICSQIEVQRQNRPKSNQAESQPALRRQDQLRQKVCRGQHQAESQPDLRGRSEGQGLVLG